MEDLAASIMSLSHSAPLYLFYNVSDFPKHHGQLRLHDDDGDDGFEFSSARAKNADKDNSAGPRACASDVSAFADELFRGGVLLPLKLPPRLQRPASSSAAPSAATSPTAAQLAKTPSWSPFASRRKQSSRGFDPFAAALEKVRRDNGAAPAPAPRRARSLSPLRGGPAGGLDSSHLTATAQKASAMPPWRRRRGAVKHFLCRALMASATAAAPRALRPRRRDGGAGACYRPGVLVCFGF